jgi:hypothetical protein
VIGRGGGDRLCGGRGKDRLKGGRGRDRLSGGPGGDVINGGGGRDRANGGPGVDLCLNVEVVRGCERQRPALHFDDQIDWGFNYDANENDVNAGDPVTTQVRVGNGISGARGYTRSTVAARGFLTGATQNLTFLAGGNPDNDDANALVNLPFRFAFFGIGYSQIAVSTNGFASFGAPALDYYTGYRPTAAEVGAFYRAAFPYWGDLHLFQDGNPLDPDPGVVSVVRTQNAVAIQWKGMGFYDGATPVRNFQLVLFRNGRIRYDYPGDNDPASGADQDELIALSGGTGTSRYHEIQREDHTVPGNSILFTPRGLGPVGTSPVGGATAALPPDTTFLASASDPRCSLVTAPTPTAPGSVRCRTPVLKRGGQTTFNVSWTAPDPAADVSFSARYVADGFNLLDGEQLLLATH